MQQFVPMGGNMSDCDRIAAHAGQQQPRFLARQQMQTPAPRTAQARREGVAEEWHEAEHMIGCAAGISSPAVSRCRFVRWRRWKCASGTSAFKGAYGSQPASRGRQTSITLATAWLSLPSCP